MENFRSSSFENMHSCTLKRGNELIDNFWLKGSFEIWLKDNTPLWDLKIDLHSLASLLVLKELQAEHPINLNFTQTNSRNKILGINEVKSRIFPTLGRREPAILRLKKKPVVRN